MTDLDKKRKTDNEGVFRKYNEAVTQGLENLISVARREGWSNEIKDKDDPLFFYCECSREDCRERIKVKPTDFIRIHKNRKRFTIKCNHDTPAVERVVDENDAYCVVEKFEKPDESVTKLRPTDKH